MTFQQFYLNIVGITLEAAKARGISDLEIMEKAYNMGYLVGHNDGFNQGVEYATNRAKDCVQEFCDYRGTK